MSINSPGLTPQGFPSNHSIKPDQPIKHEKIDSSKNPLFFEESLSMPSLENVKKELGESATSSQQEICQKGLGSLILGRDSPTLSKTDTSKLQMAVVQ